MVTDKKTKPSDLLGDFQSSFTMTCGLCQKWLIWLQGGNIICATFWGDYAVTQTSLSSSWCMSNHFLSVFNLITCQIQTWFPEFIHSVWSAAQMLRVTCDLCFWIQSGFLLLLFCFLFVCNLMYGESKVNFATSSTVCKDQRASQEMVRALKPILTLNS